MQAFLNVESFARGAFNGPIPSLVNDVIWPEDSLVGLGCLAKYAELVVRKKEYLYL